MKTKSTSGSEIIFVKSVVELVILYFFANMVDEIPFALEIYLMFALILLKLEE